LARTEAIEAVLDASGVPMSPVGIWADLRAARRDDPKMEVQVTTYDLWRRGRIDKVGRGLYVSKRHRPPDMPALSWDED
jgi:hypothetical protein